ncbi:MAG: hypothetical protein ACM357_09800 [Gemmatimonadota bacterium]
MAPARALIVLALLLAGCREEERASGPPPAAAAPPALSGSGVGCLRIGAPLAALPPGCRIVADRVVPGAEGMQERRVDVIVGSDTVIATIVADSVWRLAVTAPTLRTGDGLGPGTPAAELLRQAGSRIIGGEGRLFVVAPRHCGLSFELGSLPRELLAVPPDRVASRLPPGTAISRVLVFGCAGST